MMVNKSSNYNIHPEIVTGFSDAEGCFTISIIKNNENKNGWVVKLGFQISLHTKDRVILEYLVKYFEAGKIRQLKENSLQLKMESLKEIQLVILHFEEHPLLSKKSEDYMLFKQAFDVVKDKGHLTMEGLRQIVVLKASLNRGLSEDLKGAFSDIIPAIKFESTVLNDK